MNPRSALPLPRYVLRKRLKDAWGYFFNVPTWARKAGCPVKNEPLGPDYEVAVRRAEMVLLQAFDSWLLVARPIKLPKIAAVGTLDWVFAEYRADRRFTKLDPKTKRLHESGMRLRRQITSQRRSPSRRRAPCAQSTPRLPMRSMKSCSSSRKPTSTETR